jgi:hypothetical protein
MIGTHRKRQALCPSRCFLPALAEATAFSAKLKEAFDETANALHPRRREGVFRAGTAETHVNLDVHFEPMLELCALVLGEEEAALIRRRARVPAAA